MGIISDGSIALESSEPLPESSSSSAFGCSWDSALAATLTARRVAEEAEDGAIRIGVMFFWSEVEEFDEDSSWSMAHDTCLNLRAVFIFLKEEGERTRLDFCCLCSSSAAFREYFTSGFFMLTWFALVC